MVSRVVANYTNSDYLLQQALTLEFQNVYGELRSIDSSKFELHFDGGVSFIRSGNRYTLDVLGDKHSHDAYYSKSDKLLFTPAGGMAVKFVNRTGSVSTPGSVLSLSSSHQGSVILATQLTPVVGVMSSDGVADGRDVWVTISGMSIVLVKDSVEVVCGALLKCSDVPGRVDVVSDASTFSGYSVGYSSATVAAGLGCSVEALLHFSRW